MRTKSINSAGVTRGWYVVDASGLTLGRLATEVARRLRGKHKAEYTPHVDTGDYIIVINAEKVRLSGRKRFQKVYYRHTGYIGHMKSITADKQIQKDARQVVETAVRGMLPKNPLGRAMYHKLKVYNGPTHPHQAQEPHFLELNV